jgi:hypothetical protein
MAGRTAVCLLTVLPVHRILGAIRDGIDVARSAANGVARRKRERGANQNQSHSFLKHDGPFRFDGATTMTVTPSLCLA